jgi:hypothetical protein
MLHEYAILFAYYGSVPKDVLFQNLERLRFFNPGAPIVPLIHDGEPLLDGTVDVRCYPCPWKTEDKWRSCDTMLYRWFPRRAVFAKRFILCEWDTYSRMSIPEFYADVWDADIAATEAFRREQEPGWGWFNEVGRLGELASCASGVVPFSGTLFSSAALEAVSRGPVLGDVFCELRVATLATFAGLRLTPMPFARNFLWHMPPSARPEEVIGIFHPIKHLVSVQTNTAKASQGAQPWSDGAAQVVRWLLEAHGSSRFLHLALAGHGLDIAHVDRHLVSLDPEATFKMTEGEFFAARLGDTTYPLVFVDDLHDEERMLVAIELSLDRVARDGAIVIASGLGPIAQRFQRNHPAMEVRTVGTNMGCTVIRPGVRADDQVGRRRDGSLGKGPAPRRPRISPEMVEIPRFRRELFYLSRVLGHAPLVTRTDIINVLISRFRLESYLAIGVANNLAGNFDDVIAPLKDSVDPDSGATFRVCSDEFFARKLGRDQYDLVLIDGFHEHEQCQRDIMGSLQRLSPGGFIVVHDMNPPTEWHQRPAREFDGRSEWTGTAWKAFATFRRCNPACLVFTVDTDWGCGVIHPSKPCDKPFTYEVGEEELTWSGLQKKRREWLNLVSVDEFKTMVLGEDGLLPHHCSTIGEALTPAALGDLR